MRPDFKRLTLAVLMIGPVVGGASSCTQGQLQGQASSYVIIDSLGAASGSEPDKFSNKLASDVTTGGGVIEDLGQGNFHLAMKDPGSLDTPLVPSQTNLVTLTRYHVRYIRSDGRNTPGVDVPYPFDGAMTLTVDETGVTGVFVLVRVQAKLEAPLMALRGGGGVVAISTLAEITFFGHDQAGREVSVTGMISVNFADWADPQS